MKNLFTLLERFTKTLNKDTFTKETISRVIEERVRVKLKEDQINIKEGVLELNISAIAKSEVLLKEELIRSELKEVYKIPIRRIFYK